MTRPPSFGDTPQFPASEAAAPMVAKAAGNSGFRRIGMTGTSTAAERLARGMISRHGAEAARMAIAHLNRVIDRRNWAARDFWAGVVHAIHQRQGEAESDDDEFAHHRLLADPNKADGRQRVG